MGVIVDGVRASFLGVTGTDYTTSLYKIVQFTAAGRVDVATASTQNIVGVLMQKARANGELDVLLRNGGGIGKVVYGGTVAIGDALTANASGQAIKTTTANDQILGYAIEAGTVGQIGSFLFSQQKV